MTTAPATKPITVRYTNRAYTMMRRHLLKDKFEEISFHYARVVESATRRIFLVNYSVILDPSCYLERSRTRVAICPEVKNAVYFDFVESPYNGIINAHSHPFERGRVRFSDVDDIDDLRELAWANEQLPVGKRALGQAEEVYALSLVLGQTSLDCRGFDPGPPVALPAIEQVQVVGEPFQVVIPTGASDSATPLSEKAFAPYDRQIRAFGVEGQQALARLRVCLVGAGGIGAALAEGLVRLGATNLTLVDPDCLDVSNLNRWQGGRPQDVGQPKVTVLERRLKEMAPEATVVPIAATLTAPEVLAAVKTCDVVIGALDNHAGRFLLNRLCVQYLMPYLDAATVISRRKQDKRMELLTRLGVVVPGTTACLDCSQITYYDRRALAQHLYDPQTRRNLEQAGYIERHPEITAPSVMPLNMQAAAAVLFELLNLVTSFASLARYVRMDWLSPNYKPVRADSGNFREGPAEDCLGCAGLLGAGDSEPLPVLDGKTPVPLPLPTAEGETAYG